MSAKRSIVLSSIGVVAAVAVVVLLTTVRRDDDGTLIPISLPTPSAAPSPEPSDVSTTTASITPVTGTKKPVTCTKANMKVTVAPVTDPADHLLITGTNTGSRPCNAYSAPTLSFDLSKDLTIEVNEDSTPQSVILLQPGESTYAGVLMSSGEKGGEDNGYARYTASRMWLWFSARQQSDGNAGDGKSLGLPEPGIYVDEGVAQVTYWQSERGQALLW